MAQRPDKLDRQHFERWAERERVSATTRAQMWKLFASDPDYWGDKGWREVLNRVGRESNPGPHRHSKEWDRCVEDVKKKGTKADPYAVCTSALKEVARRRGVRVGNPLPILFALDEVGDVGAASALVKQMGRKQHPQKRRKNPWPKGRCPPHLKRFQFKAKG